MADLQQVPITITCELDGAELLVSRGSLAASQLFLDLPDGACTFRVPFYQRQVEVWQTIQEVKNSVSDVSSRLLSAWMLSRCRPCL